jgi:pimeloyl-ACP methyl ester carboxylesterase
VHANGVDLSYEAFGDPGRPAMLLIMGVNEQLLGWPVTFCEQLAERGFRVIRFDNRDVGLSTWLDELGDVDLAAMAKGDLSTLGYRFSDLVDDTVGLIAALGLTQVHLVGASMGAGIAQQIAIQNPELVASLASIMGTTSDPAVRESSFSDPTVLAPALGLDREAAIAADVALFRLIGSPEVSDEQLARRAATKVDRAYHPAGTLRQIAANATATDRTEGLRGLRTRTVVIHGERDPLVGLKGGRATAEAVGAELVVIPDMAHDLPPSAWDRIIDAIADNALS